MADRDEVLAYARELLDLDSFRDYGPMGLQVVGSPTVQRIACGVSSSKELFKRAAELGADLVIVHHGLLWENEPRTIDARMKGRLRILFDADITLAGYHLALDAHPDIGNNALLARALGIEPKRRFARVGFGGALSEPSSLEHFLERVREVLGREPLVFDHGPERVRRVAISTGGAARDLSEAAREGYDLFLTGEAEEPTLASARELGVHFVAGGHYATERLGIQALAGRLAERFALEWSFIELENPV